MSDIEIIVAPDAIAPYGHYAHAVRHGQLLFVSGILGGRPDDTGDGDVLVQTARCIDEIEKILTAGDSTIARVLKLNVYVTEVAFWPQINAYLAERFGQHRPARIVVPAGEMKFRSLVEMDAIAAVV